MHNPNPFDFVPFADRPLLKTEDEFNSMGDLFSGYLEVKMKALTPVHVVGYQEPDGNGRKSHIYRQNDQAYIPAASIRGCLRAFIETLTAGWVSQATPEYGKSYKKRHVGFSTFEWFQNKSRNHQYQAKPAVDPAYQPKASTDDVVTDIASYLFGIVIEKEKGSDVSHDALARKSKVWIEDAKIESEHLDDKNYWLPDIAGDAIMGGAKPSASNWWYMQPNQVWQRNVSVSGRIMPMAEFIGERYWGRKFYYHQNPDNCVPFYDPQNHNWEYPKHPFCKVKLECLMPNTSTDNFRIYVNRIPRQLLVLLVLSLAPGNNIRHKLGYGKAYGYGSIEFSIEAAHLRVEDTSQRIPASLKDMLEESLSWSKMAWNRERLQAAGFDVSLIDWSALDKLAKIIGLENYEKLTFTYPPFKSGYFARGISQDVFNKAVGPKFKLGNPISTTSPEVARNLAAELFAIKKPIHFQVYQENAQGWVIIKNRKP